MHQLDHQLARLHRREHIHTDGLLLYRIRETLGRLEINVGIKQGPSYLLQRLRHIDLGDPPLPLQQLKRPVQSFAQILKHALLFFLNCRKNTKIVPFSTGLPSWFHRTTEN